MTEEWTPQFYTKAAILDSLARQPQPSDEMADLVKRALLEHESLAEYFFRQLDNPAWLEPLYQRSVFREPPPVVERATDTGVAFEVQGWPAGAYLIRMASVRPEIVVKVALELDTDNASAYLDLIRAATQMPGSKAAEVVPPVVRWLSSSELWVDMLADAAQELMVHLAEEGQGQGAVDLLGALIEPVVKERSLGPVAGVPARVSRQAQPRYRPWYLRRLIEERLPRVSKLDRLSVGRVVETQLRRCMEIEGRDPPSHDRSEIWRPAIEDHEQNWGHEDLKNILTVGLRDALERAAIDNSKIVRPIIERYLTDPLSVLRRLALHLIRTGGEQYQDLAGAVLQDDELRGDSTVHHEYYLLLNSHFRLLAEAPQRDLLDRIERGPDLETYKSRAEQITGSHPSDEDIERYQRYWQLKELTPIRDALPPEWRARYETLLADLGRPEHPEFLHWRGGVWVGPTSPKDKGQLAQMPARAVLEYLQTLEPSGDPFGPSRGGLGSQLEAIVKEKPEEYVAIAPDFIASGAHPTYVYHLVRGFHEAWKDGVDLDWGPILGLWEPISLALSDATVTLAEPAIDDIDDVDWSGVRMVTARFLAGVLHRDDRLLPAELMPRIRDILLRFVQDPDPTPGDEERYAESATDWPTVRINSTRGETAFALLEYALRYARERKAEHRAVKEGEGHPSTFEPQVKAAFGEMLDKSKQPSRAVHSIFGEGLRNFLYLDYGWTVDNLDNIFPAEPGQNRYWDAAWEGYLLYRPRVHKELYEMLRPQYWKAVQRMAQGDVSRTMERTQGVLAQHLAVAYRAGHEPLGPGPAGDREGSLLAAFLESASDDLRADLARGVGSDLRSDRLIEAGDWQRLRSYWEIRTDEAQKAPRGISFEKELSAFSSWLQGAPEGLDSLASLLGPTIEYLATGHHAHEVLEYLSKESRSHPALAVELLQKLLERQATLDRGDPQDRIYLFGVEQHIWTILENALASDQVGRQEAISVINMLGERGQYQYRDLLTRAM